jgi:hypothetical protein
MQIAVVSPRRRTRFRSTYGGRSAASPVTSNSRNAELTCAKSCCAAKSSFSYFAIVPEIRSRFRRKARTAIGSPIPRT